MNAATILAQLDHFIDPATGALVPPIQPGVSAYPTGRTADGPDTAFAYGRSANTAALLVEQVMARLEGGAAAAAFTSGSAIAQTVLATLRPGDRLLLDSGMYYEFAGIFAAFGARWGVAVDQVDFTDLPAVQLALNAGPAVRLLWAECPSNPMWRVPDLHALADLAHRAGARLLVDATAATPVLCRPLAFGADLVLHSATKFLNGHGDVLAGVLVAAAADAHWRELLEARTAHGSVLPPFEAWLLLRGMRTLAVRVERVSATALRLAEWLAARAGVAAVHYPGLPSDPWHGIARRQFNGGFGGMVSFELPGGAAGALAVCARFRVFRRATSLGSTESLVEHRLTTEGAGSRCPPGLIRLSVGLEDAGDLVADLGWALAV